MVRGAWPFRVRGRCRTRQRRAHASGLSPFCTPVLPSMLPVTWAGFAIALTVALAGCGGERSDLDADLLAAAAANDVAAARELIDDGADVNAKDASQESAYLIATSEVGDDPTLLELTLDAGASVNDKDSFNGTGLIRAAERGHARIVRRLLETDIEIYHVNRLGWTALLEAIVLGRGGSDHVETVRALVGEGRLRRRRRLRRRDAARPRPAARVRRDRAHPPRGARSSRRRLSAAAPGRAQRAVGRAVGVRASVGSALTGTGSLSPRPWWRPAPAHGGGWWPARTRSRGGIPWLRHTARRRTRARPAGRPP